MSRKREQISVPLSEELRQFIERVAARQDRSAAGLIRHFVAEAARNSEAREQAA